MEPTWPGLRKRNKAVS